MKTKKRVSLCLLGSNHLIVSLLCFSLSLVGALSAQEKPALSQEQKDFILAQEALALKRSKEMAAEQRQRDLQRCLTEVSSDDYPTRAMAIYRLQEMNLPVEQGLPIFSDLLNHEANIVKAGAVSALSVYGLSASSEVDRVFEILENESLPGYVRESAAVALAEIAPKNISNASRLALSLHNEIPVSVGAQIANTLAEYGSAAHGAIPRMVALLNQKKSDYLQLAVFNALRRIEGASNGIDATQQADTTEQAPSDGYVELPERQVSLMLSDLRAQSAPVSGDVIQELLTMMTYDSRVFVKASVLETLSFVALSNADVVAVIVDNIANSNGTIRGSAISALEKVDGDVVAAIPILANAVSHTDARVRMESTKALERSGPAAAPALRSLIAALEGSGGDTDFMEVGAYLEAIRAMKGAAAAAADPLMKVYDSGDLFRGRPQTHTSLMRAYFWVVLTDLGVPKEMLGRIDAALQEQTPHVFAAAARAAGTLGANAESSVPFLMLALQPDYEEHLVDLDRFGGTFGWNTSPRLEAVRALAKIGPTAEDAIPLLQALYSRSDLPTVLPYREDIGEALNSIQPKPR
ncbi:MAG: hypothetical protein MPN21_25215 [Thermoanaerobaculia bacterium]|nr:hypothetical protein [Thermoanaerobaculia bacterium]